MSSFEKDTFKTEHKKYEALTKLVSALVLFIAMLWTMHILVSGQSEGGPIQFTIITVLLIAMILILCGVLRKLVRLEFQGKFINVIHRLTGNTRTFELSQLDGYRTREFESRSGLVRELYSNQRQQEPTNIIFGMCD